MDKIYYETVSGLCPMINHEVSIQMKFQEFYNIPGRKCLSIKCPLILYNKVNCTNPNKCPIYLLAAN